MSSRNFVVDRLAVEVHPDRSSMGRAAAQACHRALNEVIAQRGRARVVFACAPSQDEFYAALVELPLDWSQVEAFHMDEYVGLAADHPQSFRTYLRKHLLDRVAVGEFHPIPGEQTDLARACAEYGAQVAAEPIDLICLGIGENGHIAFNDPPVADFDDPAIVKPVELDVACRLQQVNDGCFSSFEKVPRHALTLTIPVFRRARRLSICVPGPRKAGAVKATLRGKVGTACPATILREHPAATLYVDLASASAL